MSKVHINAQTAQKLITLNSLMRRLPNIYMPAHLHNTKHQKSWVDYGYPRALAFAMYKDMYDRIGACRNGCDTWVDNCWLTPPVISVEENDDKRKGAELTLDKYARRIGLFRALKEADRMQYPAHYSGIIVRVADGKTPDEPLAKTTLDNIKQLIPVWEGQLTPGTLNTDKSSDRYGMPETYTYNSRAVENSPDQRDSIVSDTIHWTRIWIFNEGASGNTIYGTSAVEPAFNALMDWEKMRGSGGEGAWRAAAQRFVMTAKEGQQRPDNDVLDALSETLTEMFESFDTVPYIGGSELQPLNNNLPNVEHFLEATRQDIAAGFKLSTKGVFGSQEGKLAGEHDQGNDTKKFQSRRDSYLTSAIEQVLEWHVNFTDLPAEDWSVEWDDLAAPTSKQRLENAKMMSDMYGVFTAEEIRIEAGYNPEAEESTEPAFTDGDE